MKLLVLGVFRPSSGGGDERRLPESIECLRSDGLAVAFARVEDDALTPTVPRLQAFARQLSDLHRRLPSVPFRFGCAVDDRDGLARILDQNRDRWLALLDSIEGCDEWSVHLLAAPSPPPAEGPSDLPPGGRGQGTATDGPGTRYLKSLRLASTPTPDHERRWASHADALRLGLQGYYRDAQVHVASPPGRPPGTLFLLVPRTVAAEFQSVAPAVARGRSCRVLITGPWPPSHFV